MAVAIEIIEPKSFASAVADEIVASIDEILEEKERCSLVLAGGRTPSSIYRLLSRPPLVREIHWSRIDLFWGDERWVPHDHHHSNYHMVFETLLSQLSTDKPTVFPVDTSLASPEAGAQAYEALVKRVVPSESGVPRFDLSVLGIGEDGHTASLFPRDPVLEARGTVCHAISCPQDDGIRITLSPDALFSSKRMIFIVKGENKAEVMRRILQSNESASELPGKLYERATGSVTWFLDSAAAKKLDSNKQHA